MEDLLSHYFAPTKAGYKGLDGQPASPKHSEVMDDFWSFIAGDGFSCTGGKATRNRMTFRSGFHGRQGTADAAKTMAAHLYKFHEERKSENPALPFLYCVYAAFFDGPEIESEKHAHDLVWQQLQALHDLDMEKYDYAEGVSSDVTSIDFSYSVGSERYMVPSLNPFASRLTRRYKRPVMVFIPREQFHHIYDNGIYKKMQEVIRAHDIKMQGTYNPMLDLHETSSDAVTFSGMAVKGPAECPFSAKNKK